MPGGKWRYFAITLMLVLGLIFWNISSHRPVAVEVGRETTFLTEPRDADDYAIRFPTAERELPSPSITSAEQSVDVPQGDP